MQIGDRVKINEIGRVKFLSRISFCNSDGANPLNFAGTITSISALIIVLWDNGLKNMYIEEDLTVIPPVSQV